MNPEIKKILNGDRRALAKAITLVESLRPEDRTLGSQLLDALMPSTGKALRIAISGPPGVGKSTYIETLGLHLISIGKKVAVLAIDPSSPKNGGSILGDKTRMEDLSRSDQAFIRPSPSGGNLGGIAQKTREALLLCEAAGFDIILVETVGVGQSEIEAHSITDFFLLLSLPGSGDELQGMKKGIMELADMIVVNKADRSNLPAAEIARTQIQTALGMLRSSDTLPPVLLASALENRGVSESSKTIEAALLNSKKNGSFDERRKQQTSRWFERIVKDLIMEKMINRSEIAKLLKEKESDVLEGKSSIQTAASTVVAALFKT
jgi:LAO/AO transport system kinase